MRRKNGGPGIDYDEPMHRRINPVNTGIPGTKTETGTFQNGTFTGIAISDCRNVLPVIPFPRAGNRWTKEYQSFVFPYPNDFLREPS